MEINSTNKNYKANFQAKFLNTDLLKKTVEYAVNNNKFDKLNSARKIIENYDTFTKISVDLINDSSKGSSKFMFTSYIPRYERNSNGEIIKDYKKISTAIPVNKKNYISELYNLIVKMSHSAPENKLYRKIVKGN